MAGKLIEERPVPLLSVAIPARNEAENIGWWGFGLPLLQYVLAVTARWLQAARFGFPKGDGWLHPFSGVLFVAILANSIRWQLTGRGALWKGRRYQLMR
ncbi:MAG: hypothetical protein HY326_07010 [Chloroflexi bacterium]|nr:hypothetical protein [Chloroflexota bacterium]